MQLHWRYMLQSPVLQTASSLIACGRLPQMQDYSCMTPILCNCYHVNCNFTLLQQMRKPACHMLSNYRFCQDHLGFGQGKTCLAFPLIEANFVACMQVVAKLTTTLVVLSLGSCQTGKARKSSHHITAYCYMASCRKTR